MLLACIPLLSIFLAWQAAENAKEAKQWITNWREGKTKGQLLRVTFQCLIIAACLRSSSKSLVQSPCPTPFLSSVKATLQVWAVGDSAMTMWLGLICAPHGCILHAAVGM